MKKSVKLAAIVLVTLSLCACQESKGGNVSMNQPTTSPSSKDKPLVEVTKHLSTADINNIMKKTATRVKKVKNSLNYEYYKDHYDGNILVFRYLSRGKSETESYVDYNLYYDEQGKLIYAHSMHYRGANYSIYFNNDQVLHVKVGPFYEDKGAPFIDGDMANVKEVIKKDSSFAFVLEDISVCLENAYKKG